MPESLIPIPEGLIPMPYDFSFLSLQLDDDNEVSQMEIQEVGGVKYIFVSTSTKVYRFPLQRCSRHATCM